MSNEPRDFLLSSLGAVEGHGRAMRRELNNPARADRTYLRIRVMVDLLTRMREELDQ